MKPLTPFELATFRLFVARLTRGLEAGEQLYERSWIRAAALFPHDEVGAAYRRDALVRIAVKGYLERDTTRRSGVWVRLPMDEDAALPVAA